MASSTFEVRESDNDKSLELDEDIIMSTQVDGDHTYTKDPDVDQDSEIVSVSNGQDAAGETEDSPNNIANSRSRSRRPAKKALEKSKSPTKEAASPAKKKGRIVAIVHKADIVDEAVNNGNIEETNDDEPAEVEKSPKRPKRGTKRKPPQEKENILDQSIVDEVQNINEEAGNSVDSDEPPKKKSTLAEKKALALTKTKKSVPQKTAPKSDVEIVKLKYGWSKKSVTRQSGKSAGHVDVYIFSPEGIKFRSRPELAAFLSKTKSSLKLDDFDFSKRSKNSTLTSTPAKKTKSVPATSKKTPTPAKKTVKKTTPASPKKRNSKPLLVKIGSAKSKRIKPKQMPKKAGKAKGSKKK